MRTEPRPTFRVGDRVSLSIRPALKGVVLEHPRGNFLATAVFVRWTEGYDTSTPQPDIGIPYSGYNLVGDSAIDRLADLTKETS